MAEHRPPGTPSGDDDGSTRMGPPMPLTLVDGRYRVETLLGMGAFGRVYRAFDTHLQRTVAVKELLASQSAEPAALFAQYVERFRREARSAGRAHHPNVVSVHELHVDRAGDHYLVMEYVDGTNLRDLLAGVRTLPPARAVAIALDIARALEAVHEQEIVHRDLKPANVMVTGRGVAKLTDFGVAWIASEAQLTQTQGGHPGTPLYMSPEQRVGYGRLDGRSDLYALGAILYEMLTGEQYALARQPRETLRSACAPELAAVVEHLTAPDAAARYANATDAITDLARVAAQPPDPRPIPPSAPRRIGRRTVLAGIGGLAAAGGLAGGAWALGHTGGSGATATPVAPTTVPATATLAATPAVPLTGATKTWTDPENRITVRYLSSWQADTSSGVDESGTLTQATSKRSLLTLTGPDTAKLSVIIYDAAGSIDGDLDTFRALAANDAKMPTTIGPTQDAMVGGRPARMVTATYNENGAAVTAALWLVDGGGKRVAFPGDRIGTHRTEIESILSAVVFMAGSAVAITAPPAATATSTRAPSPTASVAPPTVAPTARPSTATAGSPTLIPWKDGKNRIALSYPSDYAVTTSIFHNNDLELTASDQSTFVIKISQPTAASVQDVLTAYINGWKAGQFGTAQGDTLRFDAPVTTGRLDTEPLSSVHFAYTDRVTNNPVEQTTWFARHRDLALQMEASSIPAKAAPTRAATANAIAASVKFLI